LQIGSPSRAPSLKRHSARRIFKPRFSPRHPSICLEIFVVAFAGLLFTDLPLLSPTFEIASPIRMSSTLVRASTEIDILRLESISAFSLDCRRPTKSKSKWERTTSGHFRSPQVLATSIPCSLAGVGIFYVPVDSVGSTPWLCEPTFWLRQAASISASLLQSN